MKKQTYQDALLKKEADIEKTWTKEQQKDYLEKNDIPYRKGIDGNLIVSYGSSTDQEFAAFRIAQDLIHSSEYK